MKTQFHAGLCVVLFCSGLLLLSAPGTSNALPPAKDSKNPQSLMPVLDPPPDNFSEPLVAPDMLAQAAPPITAPSAPQPPEQLAQPSPPQTQATEPVPPQAMPQPQQQAVQPMPPPQPEQQAVQPPQPQPPPPAAPQPPPPGTLSEQERSEQDDAVKQARAGDYNKALSTLLRLHGDHPQNLSVTRDTLAVASWAGDNRTAVALYKSLPEGGEPDYVLDAVGKSYRNLGQPEKAIAVYNLGLEQSPDNVDFEAGKIRSLTAAGRIDKALKEAKANLAKHGDRLEVLLAAGDAADQYKLTYEALHYYQNAIVIAPKNHQALQGLIHVEDEMGAPQLAKKLSDENPGLIPAAEYRHIEGDEAAALVRWGPLEPPSDDMRYAETDHAIQTLDQLIDKWSKKGQVARGDVLRARFDRLLALRDRTRMQNVVTEYNEMLAEGINVPPYALTAVADAYLYLREPEMARDLYLEALKYDPNNFEAKRQLFYAYVECDDFDDAYNTIDQLDASQPVWIRLKGASDPQPNDLRVAADRDAGMARLYGNELSDADDKISAVAFAAPYDARNREALGNIYSTRGWPRAALDQYQVGTVLAGGRDAGNEVGAALANLDLQNFQEAETEIEDLAARYPENLEVQRAERLWQVHNMAELDVKGYYAFKPDTSVNGGQGFGVETMLYSSPIDYNWRLFAGDLYAHEEEPDNEGRVSLERMTAGVEYRNGPVTASAAPTENFFHSEDRTGADVNGIYAFNDQWNADVDGEILSRNTPLRALNAGITADSANAGITWRQSEVRELTVGAGVMPFSDHNLRTEQSAAYTEQLYANPHWTLEGLGDLGTSQNSKDENRPYYNPGSDVMGLVGGRVTEVLYRRYETLYEHSLEIKPGVYWEQAYGTSPAFDMRYEQRVHYNDVLNFGVGLDFARQDYDGVPEDDISITFDLSQRF